MDLPSFLTNKYFLVFLSVLVVLLGVLYFSAEPILESQVKASLGAVPGELTFENLNLNLLSLSAELRDITLKNNGVKLLRVSRLSLQPTLYAMIMGDISVDSLKIGSPTFYTDYGKRRRALLSLAEPDKNQQKADTEPVEQSSDTSSDTSSSQSILLKKLLVNNGRVLVQKNGDTLVFGLDGAIRGIEIGENPPEFDADLRVTDESHGGTVSIEASLTRNSPLRIDAEGKVETLRLSSLDRLSGVFGETLPLAGSLSGSFDIVSRPGRIKANQFDVTLVDFSLTAPDHKRVPDGIREVGLTRGTISTKKLSLNLDKSPKTIELGSADLSLQDLNLESSKTFAQQRSLPVRGVEGSLKLSASNQSYHLSNNRSDTDLAKIRTNGEGIKVVLNGLELRPVDNYAYPVKPRVLQQLNFQVARHRVQFPYQEDSPEYPVDIGSTRLKLEGFKGTINGNKSQSTKASTENTASNSSNSTDTGTPRKISIPQIVKLSGLKVEMSNSRLQYIRPGNRVPLVFRAVRLNLSDWKSRSGHSSLEFETELDQPTAEVNLKGKFSTQDEGEPVLRDIDSQYRIVRLKTYNPLFGNNSPVYIRNGSIEEGRVTGDFKPSDMDLDIFAALKEVRLEEKSNKNMTVLGISGNDLMTVFSNTEDKIKLAIDVTGSIFNPEHDAVQAVLKAVPGAVADRLKATGKAIYQSETTQELKSTGKKVGKEAAEQGKSLGKTAAETGKQIGEEASEVGKEIGSWFTGDSGDTEE